MRGLEQTEPALRAPCLGRQASRTERDEISVVLSRPRKLIHAPASTGERLERALGAHGEKPCGHPDADTPARPASPRALGLVGD